MTTISNQSIGLLIPDGSIGITLQKIPSQDGALLVPKKDPLVRKGNFLVTKMALKMYQKVSLFLARMLARGLSVRPDRTYCELRTDLVILKLFAFSPGEK